MEDRAAYDMPNPVAFRIIINRSCRSNCIMNIMKFVLLTTFLRFTQNEEHERPTRTRRRGAAERRREQVSNSSSRVYGSFRTNITKPLKINAFLSQCQRQWLKSPTLDENGVIQSLGYSNWTIFSSLSSFSSENFKKNSNSYWGVHFLLIQHVGQ